MRSNLRTYRKHRAVERLPYFCLGGRTISLVVGSARIDESGHISGGKPGDQTGNEVSTQAYYVHSKGWYCLRPKSITVANAIAEAMLQGCRNNNIGYCQGHRSNVIEQLRKVGKLSKISVKTEADCSSLIRACCIQAGFDPGNFNTSSEVSTLRATGQFMDKIAVTSKTELFNGDVLVTKTKGHTVVVVSGNPRRSTSYYPKYSGSSGSIITALAAVGEKILPKHTVRRLRRRTVLRTTHIRRLQNLKMVNLLKNGKLIKA